MNPVSQNWKYLTRTSAPVSTTNLCFTPFGGTVAACGYKFTSIEVDSLSSRLPCTVSLSQGTENCFYTIGTFSSQLVVVVFHLSLHSCR